MAKDKVVYKGWVSGMQRLTHLFGWETDWHDETYLTLNEFIGKHKGNLHDWSKDALPLRRVQITVEFISG